MIRRNIGFKFFASTSVVPNISIVKQSNEPVYEEDELGFLLDVFALDFVPVGFFEVAQEEGLIGLAHSL